MHAKKRNGRVMLYRSRYVRKGAEGNTHGYSTQEFVGSLSLDAQEISSELAAKLTLAEREYLESKVLVPARRAAEYARRASEERRRAMEARERDPRWRAMEAREPDPRWRLDEALRLLKDAGKLVSNGGRHIDAANVSALHRALEPLSVAAKVQRDPLDAVLVAVVSATAAVNAGHYGTAPDGNVRDTHVYKRWRSIGEAVDSGKDSLLRALQGKGWARMRG